MDETKAWLSALLAGQKGAINWNFKNKDLAGDAKIQKPEKPPGFGNRPA